jgi:Tol biopolymer transport system component
MKKNWFFLLSVVLFVKLSAGTSVQESTPYVCSPRAITSGIVYTDNYSSALYVRSSDGTVRQLAASPGAGMYFTVSSDRATIGLKLVGEDGLQTPAVIDAATGSVRTLAQPARLAGQVSFTSDGRAAYTLGSTLIVGDGPGRRSVDLGTYANIAPISPDGHAAVFNNGEDQLFKIDIETGTRTLITDQHAGYFQPQWSPDNSRILYSSLSGSLFVYDCVSGSTTAIGEGLAPVWSDDGSQIAFYRKEISNGVLVNSDLYIASKDGSLVQRITNTTDVCEMDPSFVPGTTAQLMYQTCTRSEIGTIAISGTGSLLQKNILPGSAAQQQPAVIPVAVTPHFTSVPAPSAKLLDVPYINQVYDTPDWYNGSAACGPTSAMMALAYYNILPHWPVTCTWPSSHTSNWGMYISEVYWFNGITYNWSANDPNGRGAWGAFGFMWSGGSPYSRISTFYQNHGIQSATFDSPTNQAAVAEINAGNLYSICNGLTTAGHIVQAHDVDASDSHQIIVNDPYGNKNKPGYPNNFGKDAKYDWPGYNNGNQNFNTVFWAATVHYTPPAPADSIVDDMQLLNHGFSMFVKPGLPMSLWKEKFVGYKGHFWYAFTTYSDSVDTCYATWTPTLSKAGRYEIFANLPYYSASYASVAKYKIYAKDGLHTITFNQNANKSKTADTLVSLGTFSFDQGNAGYVKLGDATGIKNEPLIFDALMWKYQGAIVTSVEKNLLPASGFALGQNYPNPFNPSTVITFRVPASAHVTLSIADVLGRECAVLVNGMTEQGEHQVSWNADAFPAGIYFCRMHAEGGASNQGNYSDIKKMLLVK